jgi:restriction system protein
MDPTAFEWLVRAVLARLGYADIEVTKPSNDGGVDLRARLVAKGVTNIKTAVQAKRTASVSRPVVQNLRGSLSAHESGLLVTSGHFTDSAEREAQEPTRVPIALIDGAKLVEFMLEFGIGAREQS